MGALGRLERGTKVLLALAVLLTALGVVEALAAPRSGAASASRPLWTGVELPLQDPAPPAWLASDARWHLRVLGDHHPDAAYWGKVTLGQLAAITGEHPSLPDKKVYVFIAVGSFSTATLSRPAGGSFPSRGRVIVCEYDVSDHEVGAFAMMWKDVDLRVVPGLHPFLP